MWSSLALAVSNVGAATGETRLYVTTAIASLLRFEYLNNASESLRMGGG